MPLVSRRASGASFGCVLAALLILVPRAAEGQTTAGQSQPGRWTLEVYGGGASPSISTSGTPLTTFPVGQDFTTDAGRPSRLQASWFFGDGAKMLNDALTEFAQIRGTAFTHIVPLDQAVTTSGLTRSSGAVFGARLGRSVSRRLAVEIGVERSQTPLGFTQGFGDALERSRESFEAAFGDLLDSAPVNGVDVSATLKTSEAGGSETRVTAGLTFTLVRSGKVSAYAMAGGGLAMTGGDGPEASLVGSYAFRYFGSIPMSERDRVVIEVDQPSSVAMGVVGGGITYDVTPTTGVRLDVRLSFSANDASLVLRGSPDITSQPIEDVLSSITTPGLQFSTRSGTPSSLGAEPVTLTTFAGSGRNRHVSFTIGLFKRF